MLCPEVREECSIAATHARTAGLVHWELCGAWRAELTDSRVGFKLRGLGRDCAAVVRGGAGAVGGAAAARSSSGEQRLELTPGPPSLSSLSPRPHPAHSYTHPAPAP
eukprot:3453880-Rhodomonas_salina.1